MFKNSFPVYPVAIALAIAYAVQKPIGYALAIYFYIGWLFLTIIVEVKRGVVYDSWGMTPVCYREREPMKFRLRIWFQLVVATGFAFVMQVYVVGRI